MQKPCRGGILIGAILARVAALSTVNNSAEARICCTQRTPGAGSPRKQGFGKGVRLQVMILIPNHTQ
jgi:hypothetical protein